MTKCRSKNKRGIRCGANALKTSPYCLFHFKQGRPVMKRVGSPSGRQTYYQMSGRAVRKYKRRK